MLRPLSVPSRRGVGMAKKGKPNPMKRQQVEYAFQKAPRCTARSKRNGQRCRAPAMKGWKVCRFHGARGGAPEGSSNGAWKHGHYSRGAKADRAVLKNLLTEAASLTFLRKSEM
jgi:hypothetical protein